MKAGIFDAAWQIPTVDGKAYGMPWLLDQKYFFYNEKLLKEAGFDAPPTTWEELIDQSKVIKEKGIAEYPIVWSWGQYEAAICDWVTLLYGNGGMMVDKDGKPTFNNPDGVKTLEWMVKTIDDGITNPSSISYVEEDVRNVFSQGKAVFAVNWNYMFDLVNFQKDQSQVTGQIKPALMPAFQGLGCQKRHHRWLDGLLGGGHFRQSGCCLGICGLPDLQGCPGPLFCPHAADLEDQLRRRGRQEAGKPPAR